VRHNSTLWKYLCRAAHQYALKIFVSCGTSIRSGNICVVRHINTLWKSGSRIRSGFLCKNLIHPFGKCWLNCL
jgi:hypothetical protein